MNHFDIVWLAQADLPDIPPQALLSHPEQKNHVKGAVPAIKWSGGMALVLDSRLHHDQAWVVVYRAGKTVAGLQVLHDFRHVHDIKEAANGHSMLLTDATGRQHTLELSWLSMVSGSGGAWDNLLPSGTSFMLTNGHDFLMADRDGVGMAVHVEPAAMQWQLRNGCLYNDSTGQALGLGICQKKVVGADDHWQLLPSGELVYGDGGHILCSDPVSSQVWLQARDRSVAHNAWHVQMPGLPTPSEVPEKQVNTLSLHLRVCDDFRAGSGDSISFSINEGKVTQVLASNFERGSYFEVDVDLKGTVGSTPLFIDELKSVELYQKSNGGYGPAWKMQSLDLVVNRAWTNRVVGSDNVWVEEKKDAASWRGCVNWLDWRVPGLQSPLDFAGYTYPVRFLPWLADFFKWRSYQPDKLDGVCQLIGEDKGQILAYELKTNRLIHLPPNGPGDSYTWVYTPQKSILIKAWDQALGRINYIRHSQLAGGKPVVCAGELKIGRMTLSNPVTDIIGLLNDASGHYKPDGGQCLVHVRERLEELGLDTSETRIAYREHG
ncbi:hypothetical protein [Pseudomonas sp. NPDC089406]|uniref:hypothetical protein n=1 Tax=Pseudomonas sp. NPDC089406 TaxID=3364463 RepID=UPI00384D9FC6